MIYAINPKIFVFITFPSVIDLPASDGSVLEREIIHSHINGKPTYYGPQMPMSAIAGLVDDRTDTFVVLNFNT